jgi:hypothetical protein
MSDNKLRCTLIFRLEGGTNDSSTGTDGIALSNLSSSSTTTLLASYDHDTSASSNPNKSYADAVSMVVGNDPPNGVGEEGVIGGFKVVGSDMHQIVYGADSDGLCEFLYVVVV